MSQKILNQRLYFQKNSLWHKHWYHIEQNISDHFRHLNQFENKQKFPIVNSFFYTLLLRQLFPLTFISNKLVLQTQNNRKNNRRTQILISGDVPRKMASHSDFQKKRTRQGREKNWTGDAYFIDLLIGTICQVKKVSDFRWQVHSLLRILSLYYTL